MGLPKKDHIRKLLEEPYVTEKWIALHHAPPQERDVESLYVRFKPQMMEVLVSYASVISGVVDTVEAMRARGMKVAGTTGYTRECSTAWKQLQPGRAIAQIGPWLPKMPAEGGTFHGCVTGWLWTCASIHSPPV